MALKVAIGALLLLAVGFAAVVALVASPPPPPPPPRDGFGFAEIAGTDALVDVPAPRRFSARDGERLAYRLYDAPTDRTLIFLHGSSYHGAGYHTLAAAFSAAGVAKVVLPNLRGHYLSGARRGDVDYVGQLEDDLADLIAFLQAQGNGTVFFLGGHSSGAGLAIRFAGSRHAASVSGYLLLAPVIPTSGTLRNGDAGGWSVLHRRRLVGLLLANAFGIRGLNGLPILAFNKPVELWDGTETLVYSYRLNASYHPRADFGADLKALPKRTLVVVGERDEAVDASALVDLFNRDAPQVEIWLAPNLGHFAIFADPGALRQLAAWLGF